MIFTDDFMNPLFSALERCRGVDQREEYHPEGDVLEHSLQCFHHALRESHDIDFILAALLHDVGKAEDRLGHEAYSVDMLSGHLSPKSLWLIQQHMRVHAFLDGSMRKPGKVKELVGHPWFSELIHLARIDRLGRNPDKQTPYERDKITEKLHQAVSLRFKANTEKSSVTVPAESTDKQNDKQHDKQMANANYEC